MATQNKNNRLGRTTLTGSISSGSGSARLDATVAEKKAAEALAKAKEALELASSITGGNVSELQTQVQGLSERLTAEIDRSTKQDATHTEQLENINTNKIQIIFEEVSSEDLWGDIPSKGDN